MSCKKVQKFFDDNQIGAEQVTDARKEGIDPESAWERIKQYDIVHIAKGKKVLTFSPDETNREEILKAAIGRSGNLRAPAVEIDKMLMIGYNEEMYHGVMD